MLQARHLHSCKNSRHAPSPTGSQWPVGHSVVTSTLVFGVVSVLYSTSSYLDDLLNIENLYFKGMVNQIYQPELQLNKAITLDTEALFLDLHLSISNGFVPSKIYDKRDDFDIVIT